MSLISATRQFSLTSYYQSLNLREEDFETLRAYNDYLEMKESLIWDLNRNKNVAKHEQFLANFVKEHGQTISENKKAEAQHKAELEESETQRKERSALAREARLQELQEEKIQREQDRKSDLQRFTSTLDTSLQLGKDLGDKVVLKQSSSRRNANDKFRDLSLQDSDPTSQSANASGVMGIKKKVAKEPEKPYDPFGELVLRMQYYIPRESYDHQWSDRARKKPDIVAGGFDVSEYQGRAVLDAHAGLGIFIASEKAEVVS